MGFMWAAWEVYTRYLILYPLFTKIMTGFVCTVLGDALAQHMTHHLLFREHGGRGPRGVVSSPWLPKAFRYDWPRLFRLVAYSVVIGTPLVHFWYQILDRDVLPEAPTSMQAVLIKVTLDQLIMAPFATGLFVMTLKVLEGQPQNALQEVRAKLWSLLLANWAVWPLANIINFAFVPSSQRILYVNILAVAWGAYFSYAVNTSSPPARMAETSLTSVGNENLASRDEKMLSHALELATSLPSSGVSRQRHLHTNADDTSGDLNVSTTTGRKVAKSTAAGLGAIVSSGARHVPPLTAQSIKQTVPAERGEQKAMGGAEIGVGGVLKGKGRQSSIRKEGLASLHPMGQGREV